MPFVKSDIECQAVHYPLFLFSECSSKGIHLLTDIGKHHECLMFGSSHQLYTYGLCADIVCTLCTVEECTFLYIRRICRINLE